MLFIGDVSIDHGCEVSFHFEKKQPPSRQEVGFVVKNGYKSQRGFSIDYNGMIDSNLQAEFESLARSNINENLSIERGKRNIILF